MLVELLVLIIVRMKTLKGLPPLEILTSLGAGAALLFALRAALSGPSRRHGSALDRCANESEMTIC